MLPCKEIVRVLSSGEDLSFMKKAELQMHLMMCKHCSRYSKHLQMLTDGFRKLFGIKTKIDQTQLEQIEKTIIEKVQRGKSTP